MALFFTVYCRFLYNKNRVYGHDKGELLDDLGIKYDQLKINCDSISAINLTKNQVYHAQMKHIDVKFHFARKILEEGDLMFEKIHMKENSIDMVINVVVRAKFNHCKNLFHILLVV